MAASEESLYARLSALGIAHRTVAHPAVYTVEESRALRGRLSGAHIKNLFLRDRKKRLWLCTVLEDRDVDLKALRRRLGAQGNLSFGAPDLLWEILGVVPGAVTPLAMINDTEGRVTMVLDEGVLAHDEVNAHPLRNDRTTTLSSADLLTFLDAEGHAPIRIDFGRPLDPDTAA